MNRPLRLFAALSFLTAAAIGARAIAGTIQDYANADNPYLGRVEVNVEVPGDTRTYQESGSGSAYFIETGNGQTRLVVSGSIREESDNGFTVDGVESEAGWSSSTGDLTISEEGRIVGNSMDYPNRYRYDGLISEERFNLEVEHELVEGIENGLPPGTKFTYRYTLSREVEETASDTVAPERNGDRTCRRTVWRTRNIANLSGGPMIMVQVPECVE